MSTSQDAVLAMHPGCEAFRSPMGGTLCCVARCRGRARASGAGGRHRRSDEDGKCPRRVRIRPIETIVAGAGHAVQAGDILFMFSPAEETSDDGRGHFGRGGIVARPSLRICSRVKRLCSTRAAPRRWPS